MGLYETHVKGKTAEEILESGLTADSNQSSYLQVAAQIRSHQELIDALRNASKDSNKAAQKIVWLTVALFVAAILEAVATAWSYLAWWVKHAFHI